MNPVIIGGQVCIVGNLVPRAFSSFKMAAEKPLAKAAKVAPKVR